MDLVLAATETAVASQQDVNLAWIVSFVIALATLAFIWALVPGVKGLVKETVVGKDGRVSTSKFQFMIWTLVIFFALFSVLIAWAGVHFFGDLLGGNWAKELEPRLAGGLESFLSDGLTDTYMILLGIPVAGAVASKGITASKVEGGSIVKAPKAEDSQTSGARELIGDDKGGVDIGDLQYLLFNLLTIGYFLVLFFTDPSGGLPEIPDTLLGLTGVAAAGYVGKKSIYTEPPVLLGIMPSAAAPDAPVRVYGEKLLAATPPADGDDDRTKADKARLGAIVTFNLRAAEIVGEPSNEMIEVTVPKQLDPGSAPVQVVRPPGAKSDPLPFTVLEPGA